MRRLSRLSRSEHAPAAPAAPAVLPDVVYDALYSPPHEVPPADWIPPAFFPSYDPNDWNDTSALPYQVSVTTDTVKSRVETQIKATLTFSPAPPESYIHLPTATITKKRQQLRHEFKPDRKTLDLDVIVVCDHDRFKPVKVCTSCGNRERKRASRKKTPSVDDIGWLEQDDFRGVMFNCSELVDIPDFMLATGVHPNTSVKGVELPMRIPCYSRHHDERIGFRVYFVLRDFTGRVVARTVTEPILITDDHKIISTANAARMAAVTAINPTDKLYGQSDDLAHNAKKRKSSQDDSAPSPPLSMASKSRASMSPTLSRSATHTSLIRQNSSLLHPSSSASSLASAFSEPMLAAAAGPEQISLQRLIPPEGPIRGGIEVTILGVGFRPGVTVLFGEQPAIKTQIWSSCAIVAVLPPAATPGPVVVRVAEAGQADPSPMGSLQLFTYVDDADRQLMELALQVVGLKMTGKIENAREIAMRLMGHTDRDPGSTGVTGEEPIAATTASLGPDLEANLLHFIDVIDYNDTVHKVHWQLRNRCGQTMIHLAAILNLQRFVAAILARGASYKVRDRSGFTALHFATMHKHKDIVSRLLNSGANP
ncbi:uncharacterized protein V1510DRAFT_370178, partial [Dipodascopsis tothii]|uniref:uncharacterized protein n=1 Tax=Dipodascopsis tothii TaxID=44089 RepID=UPI0034CFAF59